jgi:hypothetical protein
MNGREVVFMKIGKTLTAAGLTVAIGAFAPSVFAFGAGGVGSGAPGMPATSSGQSVTQETPAEGQPGTQAPASASPIGSASSDYMSNEGADGPADSSMSGPSSQYSETRARALETTVEREIVAARADGMDVASAEHQKWLGSTALSQGDRDGAMRHFDLAQNDLRAERFPVSGNNVQYNNSWTNLNANDTSQNASGSDMQPNRGTNDAY